jgi:triacylglycerol esterase/lipase EstA (alpha/beta hydrolase family)
MAGDNDGMVPTKSAHWGDFRGEIPADHFDEVGQLFGITSPNFDHRDFYLGRARDLASEGH